MTKHIAPAARGREAAFRTACTVLFAVLILVPSMIGFAAKFLEFIHTFRSDASGAFAVTPMVNYLLASLGFLCLLIWATRNGMFHNIESAKQTMLDNERMLDAGAGQGVVDEHLEEGQGGPLWPDSSSDCREDDWLSPSGPPLPAVQQHHDRQSQP